MSSEQSPLEYDPSLDILKAFIDPMMEDMTEE